MSCRDEVPVRSGLASAAAIRLSERAGASRRGNARAADPSLNAGTMRARESAGSVATSGDEVPVRHGVTAAFVFAAADQELFEPRYHVPRSQLWERSAGRQRGHVHLHVRARFDLGRIHRQPGQALCGRRGWYERPLEREIEVVPA